MKASFIFSFFLFVSCNSNIDITLNEEEISSTPKVKSQWIKTLKSDDKSQGRSIHFDSDNNNYIITQFKGTLSFDEEVSNDTFTSLGTYGVALTKFNSQGVYQWTKAFGDVGTSYARPKDLRITSTGDIVILGDFNGTMDTDPGPGVNQITSNGGQDLFIIKLDSNGDLINSFNIGNTGYDESESLEIDGSDNIFYLGTLQKKTTDTDFDPTVGNDYQAGLGGFDVFVTKINSNDSYGWTYYVGGTGTEWAGGIDIDLTGNIYIGFKYADTIDADPLAPIENHTSAGSSDVLTIKISNSGTYINSMSIGGDDADYNYDVDVDAYGNILLTGSHKSTNFDFDPSVGTQLATTNGNNDMYFAKYDSSLNLIWAKSIGSVESDRLHAIDLSQDGSIYLAGYFSGQMSFNTPKGVKSFTPHTSGSADGIILKYSLDGDFLDSFTFTGDGTNQLFDLKIIDEKVCAIGSYQSSTLKINGHTTKTLPLSANEDSFLISLEE